MRISDWSSDVCSSDLGQLIASVLSKKIAAGATHVVLDIPVGPTAKVRSADAAERLAATLTTVAGRFGLKIGRASCRGRVCQYVCDSVADLSIKKKQIRDKNKTTRHIKIPRKST